MRAVRVLGLCVIGLLAAAGCASGPQPGQPEWTTTFGRSSAVASSPPPVRVFDAKAMSAGVTKVLSENYGLHDLGEVTCPDRQAVTDGNRFQCTVDVAGERKGVPITVTGTGGQYRVDAPR
ncbi:DUF4333 domain-containing protein [Amycolatopsis saalfeldensis]|uniref:DUF4333 domain-containing protein n=1 Tax=Amycolatopsis saalfeldensis TaxID=394193 RepID=A0A1H8SR01_9PSEU|nr:DUF4333 domain-containing protein [Amycolatopsis saalfeldensis]SEO80936.1 protein of unknown function [Amycolatopsis saalfeldensis]